MKKTYCLAFLGLLCFMTAGCVTTTKTYHAQPKPAQTLSKEVKKIEIKEIEMEEPAQKPTIQKQIEPQYSPLKLFTYHRVKKNQTLWAISRYYSIPVQDLMDANRISSAKRLKAGQILKIPLAKREIELSLGSFEWPLYGKIISHYKEDLSGKPNNGIDIEPENSYVVYASKKGKVEFSQQLKGYGYTIILKHPQGLNTVYSNLSSSFVNEEDQVTAKQAIGEVGKDVRTQEAFLHFEIRKEDRPLNPLRHLP